jgi:hypothetical protein
MALHASYERGDIEAVLSRLAFSPREDQLSQLRHVDDDGDTILSLIMRTPKHEHLILDILDLDQWALGVRCKRTGNYPLHVMFEHSFSLMTRIIVTELSQFIICSYNNKGDTVLHTALKNLCDDDCIEFLNYTSERCTIMLTPYIHQNLDEMVPLVLAVQNKYSQKTIDKIVSLTSLAASHWTDFFTHLEQRTPGIDVLYAKQNRLFASFTIVDHQLYCINTELVFHDRIIQLESGKDCDKSFSKKRDLLMGNFAEKLVTKCRQVNKDPSMVKLFKTIQLKIKASSRADMIRVSTGGLLSTTQEEMLAANLVAVNILREEEEENTRAVNTAKKNAQKNAQKKLHRSARATTLVSTTSPLPSPDTSATSVSQDKYTSIKQAGFDRLAATKKIESMQSAAISTKTTNTKDKDRLPDTRVVAKDATDPVEKEDGFCISKDDLATQVDKEKQPKCTTECSVCFECAPNMAIVPCHHMCLCKTCADIIMLQAKPTCPICRVDAKSVIKLFF